jgi:gluconolactonase
MSEQTASVWNASIPTSSPPRHSVAMTAFSVLADGLDHPECVAWSPYDSALYAGGEAGQIYRISLDGSWEQIASSGGFVLGVCLDGGGNLYACDSARGEVFRLGRDGDLSLYADGGAGSKMLAPNYAAFDDAGNLFVSDSGAWKVDNGRIWVIRPDGRCELLDAEIPAFPNGLALSPDRQHLYVATSSVPAVVRVPISDGQTTGAVETVASLLATVPDGLAFNEHSDLFISCYAPDLILILSPSGVVSRFAEDPERVTLASPTNLAFCGPDLRTLAVASLGRWHIATTEVGVCGAELCYPVELP